MTENQRRINRATLALHAYYANDPSGDDRQTVLVDLLTDLRHYADYHPEVNFDDALLTAEFHHEAES